MKSFFVPALEKIHSINPRILNQWNSFSSSVSSKSKRGYTDALDSLLDPVLQYAGKEQLVDPDLIAALIPLLHKFIYEESYGEGVTAVGFLLGKIKMEDCKEDLAKSPELAKFAQTIISTVSFEILDEKGRLQPRLIELFGLNLIIKQVDAVQLALRFITLFLHRIVVPVLLQTWPVNKSVIQGTLNKVTPRLLANQICTRIKKNLDSKYLESINKKASKSQIRIHQAIRVMCRDSSAMDRISTSRLTNLVTILTHEICQIPEVEEESGLLSSFSNFFSVAQSPADYKKEVRAILQLSYDQELVEISIAMVRFAQEPLDILITQMLTIKLNDMKLYGKGLADSFDHHDFSTHLAVHPEQNDFPIVANDGLAPFPHEITRTLSTQLHDLMLRKAEGFENSTRLKKFVRRTILYAYAQVLDEEGDVKEVLRECQASISDNLAADAGKEENDSSLLVSTFIRKLLITVFYEWLSDDVKQHEYRDALSDQADRESPEDLQEFYDEEVDLDQAALAVTSVDLVDEVKEDGVEGEVAENKVAEDKSENDAEFNAPSPDEVIESTTIFARVGLIEKGFNLGLSEEFLAKIKGFPFNAHNKKFALRFALPLLITPPGKTLFADVIMDLQAKLNLVEAGRLKLAEVLTKFIKNERPYNPFEGIVEDINAKREKNSRMLSSLKKFKAVQEVQTTLNAKYAALLMKTSHLIKQPALLHRELAAIKLEAMITSSADFEKMWNEFNKSVTDFNTQVEEASKFAEDFSWDLLTINSQAIKLQRVEQFCHEMGNFSAVIAGQIRDKALNSLSRRGYYMKRSDFFPIAIPNSIGWESRLENEEAQINGSFDMIKGGFQVIKEHCDKLYAAPLTELIADENSYENLNMQMLRTQMEIDRNKVNLLLACSTVDDAYLALHEPIKRAETLHKEIYNILRHILRDTSFWKRRVSKYMGGGVLFTVGLTKYQVPTRAGAMMAAVKALDIIDINPNERNTDPDLKIIALLVAYNSKDPGWGFWRYNKTIAFYAIVDDLITVARTNLYDLAKMENIKRQLIEFMRVTCGGPRYTMFQTYQSRVAEHKEEKAPGPMSQLTSLLSGLGVGP